MRYLREWQDKCRIEQEAKEAGRTEGRTEGHMEYTFQQLQAKIKKNKSLETIADELETQPEAIHELYELVLTHPGLPSEELLALWK